MTVPSTATEAIYTENGSTLIYPFTTFSIFAATDLLVTSINTVTGVQTTLILGTDYTVTINTPGYSSTGSITKTLALSSSYNLVIQRVLPITQQIVFTDNVGTDAYTYEEGYDRLTMIAQQLQAQINQAVLLPIGSTGPLTLPLPVQGQLLGWSNGALINFTVSGAAPGGSSFVMNFVFLGDGVSNNSWRFSLSGNTCLIQTLQSGTWTTKGTFS